MLVFLSDLWASFVQYKLEREKKIDPLIQK